ncbi:phage holin family protein [bacterium]|nr:phage holin family protein [bacterium]
MDLTSLGMASVACITVICYLAALAIKQTPLANKWLPTICGVLGALLGLAGYYGGMVDFPSADPLTALAVGIVSGLAATGADQVAKQLKKGE